MNTPSKSIPPSILVAGTYNTSCTQGLQQWRQAMPIVDVSEQALEVLVQRWAGRGRLYYIWLRVLRPLSLLAMWGFLGWYVWRNFFAPEIMISAMPTLRHYAAMVTGIMVLTLAWVVLDRLRRQRRRAQQGERVTPQCVAQYASLKKESMVAWQQQRSLLVYHDDHGLLRDARAVAQ